jgi:hypothetical protein
MTLFTPFLGVTGRPGLQRGRLLPIQPIPRYLPLDCRPGTLYTARNHKRQPGRDHQLKFSILKAGRWSF